MEEWFSSSFTVKKEEEEKEKESVHSLFKAASNTSNLKLFLLGYKWKVIAAILSLFFWDRRNKKYMPTNYKTR